jgi:Cof subfamily protein (haloacid dehalogenase superfamily)
MRCINIISVDLDGTLLKNDSSVSVACIESIRYQKNSGRVIVFNTSRPLKLVPMTLYEEFYNNYWLLSNGACCIKSGKKIFENLISSGVVKSLVYSFLSIYKKTFFSIESNNGIYSCFKNKEKCEQFFAKQIDLKELIKKEATKILIIDEGKESICFDRLQRLPSNDTKLLVTDNNKYIQIMPNSASKLLGVERIVKELHVSLDNVLSFGDDLNDYELIRASGIGVAMGNAHSSVKEVSKFITKSNGECGIHHFFSVNSIN